MVDARLVLWICENSQTLTVVQNSFGICVASCSSVAISMLANHVTPGHIIQLSLVLNTTYHAPAPM